MFNSDVNLELVSKKKFGVTLHKNMSLKEMANKWTETTPEIKQKYPELTILFNSANIQVETQATLRKAQVVVDDTYKTIKGAIEDAVAIITGQVQQPAAKAASQATKIATETQALALEEVKIQALNLITSV
jgi:short-subunit dehydrogenase involved in D-alanine esterification of teichoic acids